MIQFIMINYGLHVASNFQNQSTHKLDLSPGLSEIRLSMKTFFSTSLFPVFIFSPFSFFPNFFHLYICLMPHYIVPKESTTPKKHQDILYKSNLREMI